MRTLSNEYGKKCNCWVVFYTILFAYCLRTFQKYIPKNVIIFTLSATSFLHYLHCVREMNIRINAMIWIKKVMEQPPISLLPSSFLAIYYYFVDGELLLLFYLLVYWLCCLRITCWKGILLSSLVLYSSASANSYSDDSGTENVK